MNKLLRKMITVAMLVATAVASLASERNPGGPMLRVASRPVALNATEVTKYQQMTAQSEDIAAKRAAGASNTTKTVLIVVGVVVVVGTLAAVATTNPMAGTTFKLGGGKF